MHGINYLGISLVESKNKTKENNSGIKKQSRKVVARVWRGGGGEQGEGGKRVPILAAR